MITTLKQWLRNLLTIPPATLTSIAALEEIARYLASETLVSKRKMESKRRLGVPFKNAFAALEPGHPEVVSLAYDESFMFCLWITNPCKQMVREFISKKAHTFFLKILQVGARRSSIFFAGLAAIY